MSQDQSTPRFRVGISTKLLCISLLVLLAVVGVNYAVFMSGYRESMLDAYEDKASSFTAVADEAKSDASVKFMDGTINVEQLLAEAQEQMENGASYQDTRFFNAIPVIVGWHDAAKAAEKEHIAFEIVAHETRNPDNAPEQGGFSDRLLTELTSGYKANGQSTISRVNEETNTLHYMRAIALDESCMSCHGDPSKYDTRDEQGNFDGDGNVDLSDYNSLASNFNPLGYGTAAVPEPAAALLALLALLLASAPGRLSNSG